MDDKEGYVLRILAKTFVQQLFRNSGDAIVRVTMERDAGEVSVDVRKKLDELEHVVGLCE